MDIKIVKELYSKLVAQKTKLVKYQRYYNGDHDILQTYKKKEIGSNEIEVHNYCKLFIDNNTGYLVGVPISVNMKKNYTIDDYTIADYYNEMVGIQQINQELMITQQIYGFTFEINYVKKDKTFGIDIKTPLEMSIKRKGNKVLYALLERSEDEEVEIFDLFDILKNKIYTISISKDDEKKINKLDETMNIIDNPVIVVKNNRDNISELKDIISLNDAYNQVSSDWTNEIADHRSSYLHIHGAKMTKETFAKAKESGILFTTGKHDNDKVYIEWLTRTIDESFINGKLSQLETQMYNVAKQVNFNDVNMGSNTSSLALRNKLITLDNNLTLKEGHIKDGITIRLKNLQSFLVYRNLLIDNELSDYKNVTIKLIRNIPTSTDDLATTAINLNASGMLSKKTGLELLGLVQDVNQEMDNIKEEKEDNDFSNLMMEVGYVRQEDKDTTREDN